MIRSEAGKKSWPWPLAVMIWLIFVVAMMIGRAGQVAHFQLPDSDDYTRLVQVENWLDGAGWRDVTLHRLDPPNGVVMHWSRLPDVPLGAVMAAVEPFAGRDNAAITAVLLVPSLYLLAFILLVTWMAARLFGEEPAYLAPILAAFAVPATGQFMPGRIDHHGLQVLLTLVMLAGAIRLYEGGSRRWAVLIGAAGGVALAIGAEALPQLLAAYAALGVGWLLRRPGMIKANVATSVSLAAVTGLLLLLDVERGPYFVGACDSLSLVYAMATGLAAAVWLLLWAAESRLAGPVARGVAAVALAGLATAALLLVFPQCAGGPYGALPPELAQSWLTGIGEAQSAFHLAANDLTSFLMYYVLPAVAVVTVAVSLVRRPDEAHWWPLAVFLAVTTGVAMLQIRGATVANAIAVVGAVPAYHALYSSVRRRVRTLSRVAAAVAVMVLSPLTPVTVARTLKQTPQDRARTVVDCGLPESLRNLNALPAGTIMAPSNMGPMIMARTHHSVLGAPYHRDVDGLTATLHFFAAPSDEAAHQVLRREHVDYVVYCVGEGPYSLPDLNDPHALATRLEEGHVPRWLSPVPDPRLHVFRVEP
ncbi:MAG: hypothetical protein GC201_02640 [Alphaproteobacteria bacterium]|nr:hypothetical protein [Alphaproteobacteria bacterium]